MIADFLGWAVRPRLSSWSPWAPRLYHTQHYVRDNDGTCLCLLATSYWSLTTLLAWFYWYGFFRTHDPLLFFPTLCCTTVTFILSCTLILIFHFHRFPIWKDTSTRYVLLDMISRTFLQLLHLPPHSSVRLRPFLQVLCMTELRIN